MIIFKTLFIVNPIKYRAHQRLAVVALYKFTVDRHQLVNNRAAGASVAAAVSSSLFGCSSLGIILPKVFDMVVI